MVVDDSAVIRGLTKRILESDNTIKVVASAGDGEMALRAIERTEVDVVVLDIEMPRMDGLTALPLLIKARPKVRIIMSSTLTTRNAEISLRALRMGAADYVPKPTATVDIHSGEEFRETLVRKVRALGEAAQRAQGLRPSARSADGRPALGIVKPLGRAAGAISLRPVGRFKPDILAIGSSTGGPQALFEVIKSLGSGFQLPIVITQHMPATFTRILADHLASVSGRDCVEAQGGEVITPGHVYVAPGENHMLLEKDGPRVVTRLTQDPPENFCRPSVDPMLRSVIKVYGARILTVILTGMGQDGLKGCEAVVAAGGTVIGQDEETSVVWGMPGAVAGHGLCSAVLPLVKIGPYISNFSTRTAA